MSKFASLFRATPGPAPKRWIAALLVSALLHWLAIEWANGNLVIPTPSSEPIITAQLQSIKPSRITPEPAISPKKPRVRRPTARPKQTSQPVPTPAPTPETALTQEPAQPQEENLPAGDAGGTEESTSSIAGTADNKSADEAPNYELNLPPSAELKYEVHAQKKGIPYYGTGIINWQTDGSRYAILGKAKAAFFTVLEFKSEGEVDKSGIAPVLYVERSGNRAETNTHFHRERNTISFSASRLSYPRLGGEQDRASIIWQLAAMGRARPDLFKSGEELNIFVAGVRNAAPWRIYILGEEEIQLDGGLVKSWHVKSVPQQGGYEKTLDIWFASGYEWYPIKLRQTEVSGDYLELTLSNLMLAQQ